MGPLAMTVLEIAMAQQVAWAGDGLDLTMAVNLSAANLADEQLSWTLASDGRWIRVEPADPDHAFNAQEHLAGKVQQRARRRIEEAVDATPLRTHR